MTYLTQINFPSNARRFKQERTGVTLDLHQYDYHQYSVRISITTTVTTTLVVLSTPYLLRTYYYSIRSVF